MFYEIYKSLLYLSVIVRQVLVNVNDLLLGHKSSNYSNISPKYFGISTLSCNLYLPSTIKIVIIANFIYNVLFLNPKRYSKIKQKETIR